MSRRTVEDYVIIERMKPSSDQLQNKNVLVVKIQTTGTQPDDELLELCLLDARDPWRGGDKKGAPVPVFHARFRPEYKSEWPGASRVNGITPSMVAKEHLLDDLRADLIPIFMNCDCLVGFNAGFDFAFLRRQFLFRASIMTVDLMRDWTEYVTAPTAKGEVAMRMPYLTQKELFSHFDWAQRGNTLAECLGLRHCFLKLIKLGAIHIRRPLLERRFNRISEQQLLEVQDTFQRRIGNACAGPFLNITQLGEDVVVKLGIEDKDHILYEGNAPEASVTVPGCGAALEVRDRIACALEGTSGLPGGLVRLVCNILRNPETDDSKKEGSREGVPGKPQEQGQQNLPKDVQENAPKAAQPEAQPESQPEK